MRFPEPRAPHGFTLLELIVVITIISALLAVALDRFLYYQERAEQAVMNADLEAIKMGLRIRMVQLIASGHGELVPALESENPMQWLEQPPSGYLGEYAVPAKPGSWYFSSEKHEIIYVPKSRLHLIGGAGDDQELYFRSLLTHEQDGKRIAGITMVPVTPFQWF